MATTKNITQQSGSTNKLFSFTFPYLNTTDVKVATSSDNVTYTDLATTAYSFANATVIEFDTAPSNGVYVKIYRDTDNEKLTSTFYPGSSIRSEDLNDNYTQVHYVAQETENLSAETKTTADTAKSTADTAKTASDAAKLATDTYVAIGNTLKGDGVGSNPKGVKYAVDTADAAKLATDTYVAEGSTLKGDGQGSNPKGVKYAVDTADTAKTSADSSDNDITRWIINGDGTATSGSENDADFSNRPQKPEGVPFAVNTANTAKTAADAAKDATDNIVATKSGSTWTIVGDGQGSNPKGVKYAVDTAETADTNATTAKDATDTIVATKSGSTWTLKGGGTTAQNGSDPKGVKYAVETADTAKTATDTYVHDGSSLKGDGIGGNPQGVAYAVNKANEAINSVAGAGIYTAVPSLSDLTTNYPINSTNDGKFYQLTDSTGVTRSSGTFSPNTFSVPGGVNFPSNFTGDDELTIKVKINNTSGKYEVQEYYSNDPETRYRKKVVIESKKTISEDYRVGGPTNESNGLIVGPCTIAATYTVTIPADTRLVVL